MESASTARSFEKMWNSVASYDEFVICHRKVKPASVKNGFIHFKDAVHDFFICFSRIELRRRSEYIRYIKELLVRMHKEF